MSWYYETVQLFPVKLNVNRKGRTYIEINTFMNCLCIGQALINRRFRFVQTHLQYGNCSFPIL